MRSSRLERLHPSLSTLTKLYGHSSQAVTLAIMEKDIKDVFQTIDY